MTFTEAQARERLKSLPGWRLSEDKKSIVAEYRMKDFLTAIEFIRTIAPLAEKADHHPDLHLTGYRRLEITLSTHSEGGLTEKDFQLAGVIQNLPKEFK